jgi:4'-phosphopantetheinyl transferase
MSAIGDRTWSTPPPRPRASSGVVHVWRADLTAAAVGLEELLCAEEQARAAQIVREHDRALWARSRGGLRALLGRYLDTDPRELRFVLGPHGKPALHEETELSAESRTEPSEGLRFNLSHTGELMLVAVTAGREVGVDVERARDPAHGRVDELAIAARVLGPGQARRLQSLDGEERTAEFLRAWTMREAAVKCLGIGLASVGYASAEGLPSAEGSASARLGSGDATAGLWTAELDVSPRAAAAVAVAGEETCELRCWDAAPTLTP